MVFNISLVKYGDLKIFTISNSFSRKQNKTKQQTGKQATCGTFSNRLQGCMRCGPCYQRSYKPTGREKMWWSSWEWPESNSVTTLDIPLVWKVDRRVVFKWLPILVALRWLKRPISKYVLSLTNIALGQRSFFYLCVSSGLNITQIYRMHFVLHFPKQKRGGWINKNRKYQKKT